MMRPETDSPNLLASGGLALARALRWLALAAAVAALVYLVQVRHGARGLMTSPAMASVAILLGLLLAAGATRVLASTRPRNGLLRTAAPVLAAAGVLVFLTGSPEGSARSYFDLHRADLDALSWELQRERPFQGSFLDAGAFEGRESLRSRLDDLGITNVLLEGGRTVMVYLLHLDGYHGFVQVEQGSDPPAPGEAFRPGWEHLSYRQVQPLEGGWYYFQVLEGPATRPAAGAAPEDPSTAPPPSARVEGSPGARAFFEARHAALDTLIWEFGRGPIWHGRLEDVRGLEPERRERLLERVRALGFREAFLESGRVIFLRDRELPGDTLEAIFWAAATAPVPPRGGRLLAGYRFHRLALLGRFEEVELWPIDGTWHEARLTRLPEPWWTRQRTPPPTGGDTAYEPSRSSAPPPPDSGR